ASACLLAASAPAAISPPLFSSSGSGAPRDLHSFPTRRSSDLFCALRVRGQRDHEHAVAVGERGVEQWAERFEPRVRRGGDRVRTDRKSTRLNSSHVKISYAVFCLKKKKHTEERTHVRPQRAPR